MGVTFGLLFILAMGGCGIALIFLWDSIDAYLEKPTPKVLGVALSCGMVALYSAYLMFACLSMSKTNDVSESTDTVPIASAVGLGTASELGQQAYARYADSGDYMVLAKTGGGGYQKTVLPADSTTVYSDGGDSPSYEKVTETATSRAHAYVFPFGELEDGAYSSDTEVTYRLHVPSDTESQPD